MAEAAGAWPLTLADVLAARERLRPFLPPTPLRRYPLLDEAVGLRVLVKHENHQPTNAFKIRNGLAALTALLPGERSCGVVAATMGNYGLGLAWAGQALGIGVTICVPRGANPDKVADMRGLGAEIVEEGRDYDEACEVMDRLVRERALLPIHGVNHPMMPAGAGTMTLEIIEQAEAMGERVDAMVLAVGGGSQAVGAMTVLRERGGAAPPARVYGVQAEGAPTIYRAWRRREPMTGDTPSTFAEGIATRSTYELTFGALCEGLAGMVLVSDAEIGDAMRLLIRTTHNLVEPAGAAGLAGLRKLADTLRDGTVVIVMSGGNVGLETLRSVVAPAGG